MTSGSRDHQHGFTLVELMAVVAIVGILLSTAIVAVRTEPDVDDMAQRVVGLVQEASRIAVASGAATPLAADPGRPLCRGEQKGARTRLRVYFFSGRAVIAMQRFDVDPTDPTITFWTDVGQSFVGNNTVTVTGLRHSTKLADPTISISGGSDEEILCCYPDGRCDSATLFMERGGGQVKRVRVEVLPLGGTGTVFDGW